MFGFFTELFSFLKFCMLGRVCPDRRFYRALGVAALFSARGSEAGPCVSGGPPAPDSAYTITRHYNLIGGNSFTVERQAP
jgi:hypothetical protein